MKFEKTSSTPLTVWAHSYCRSTLATYLALADQYPCSVEIVVCGKADPALRVRTGFQSREFDEAYFKRVGPTVTEALDMLASRREHVHMFCAYHGSAFFEALLRKAIVLGLPYFIASEAPQNMEQPLLRRMLKELYIRTVLRFRVRRTIRESQFIVCYSGYAPNRLRQVGWPQSKIEEFGYYPPSLLEARPELSIPKRRNALRDDPMHFLLSGTHCRHKSPMTLIEAVEILERRGLAGRFKCTVTGVGFQTLRMEERSLELELPILFRGLVDLEELIALYATVDVFVATGVNEPWGIRVNDALQLGCPALVSAGMGAVTLVQDSGLGWSYPPGSSEALANTMQDLIEHPAKVKITQERLRQDESISPTAQAQRLAKIIQRRLDQ